MQKFIDTVTATGEGGILTPLGNASVTVYITGTTTKAALYSDNGITAKANPFTSSATGVVAFYAPDDRYDIVVAKAGFSTVTVADVILEDIDDNVITDISNARIASSTMTGSTISGTAINNGTMNGTSIENAQYYGGTVEFSDIIQSNMTMSAINSSTVTTTAITGSTVNSTPIGASAPSTARFTSVSLASGATGNIGFGEMRLNSTELTLDVGLSGGVVGQMFEEAFISIVNNSGVQMISGQVVGFNGVDNANSLPYAKKISAGPEQEPLHIIGVVTQTIAPGSLGRITTFGKVRNVDTTGFPVSEVWAQGDLLYVHPTIPGALTNVEPTSPYQNILVAAVLRVGATTGTLLVRPMLQAHKHYGGFSSTADQTAVDPLTPYAVTYNTVDTSSGVIQDPIDPSCISPTRAGLYNIQFSIQLSKTNSSTGYIWIWPRIDGVDVPNSATKVSVNGNAPEVIPSWNFLLPLDKDAKFQLMYAVSDTTVYLDAVDPETFCPAIPSVILTVAQVNQ